MFEQARPLGERGMYWLKVQLANLAGQDKYVSLVHCISLFCVHEHLVIACDSRCYASALNFTVTGFNP